MSDRLRLILFDVDGTLVDSQADILASMNAAFASENQPAPSDNAVLSLVGVSLEQSVPQLAPGLDRGAHLRMVDAYKAEYMRLRKAQSTDESSPLYPGVKQTLTELAQIDNYLLGVVTGKSMRGLSALLEGHGLTKTFLTLQTSDHHPSKPHPAMLQAAISEMGMAAEDTVMIGDTTYDMTMAQSAGTRAIGVSWGYHAYQDLASLADTIVHGAADLPSAIDALWKD